MLLTLQLAWASRSQTHRRWWTRKYWYFGRESYEGTVRYWWPMIIKASTRWGCWFLDTHLDIWVKHQVIRVTLSDARKDRSTETESRTFNICMTVALQCRETDLWMSLCLDSIVANSHWLWSLSLVTVVNQDYKHLLRFYIHKISNSYSVCSQSLRKIYFSFIWTEHAPTHHCLRKIQRMLNSVYYTYIRQDVVHAVLQENSASTAQEIAVLPN